MCDHNPPAGWAPPPVPTEETEEVVLRDAFGDPDENGIYAPHVEG